LFRYALGRLRDVSLAEDMVQETFLAALKNQDNFEGRSSERSWLISILKHKLVDHYRRSAREEPVGDIEFFAREEQEAFVELGWSPGSWRPGCGPLEWSSDAASNLDREAFWNVFWTCLEGLPDRVAAVFTLREMDELTSEEICDQLGISPGNLFVMLHRARMALRRCLESSWFRNTTEDPTP
jgi:RNA polymerase sigma-70 factor (ECF subfamily)